MALNYIIVGRTVTSNLHRRISIFEFKSGGSRFVRERYVNDIFYTEILKIRCVQT